ncbi:hypothetical protein K435DRAFT_434090 [Dendrothele bispora CBS 962.96]|uniref:C2H2-type domain-containing protein n=1 Tax=Dendrothele bispora (strain CBS 962.96) TaxID=1314807 RepID=A0A4S8L525_DENBC|nr:hypothetical protein K435DRAFT_434090 [Dendrothele bispora CBS 962.96]
MEETTSEPENVEVIDLTRLSDGSSEGGSDRDEESEEEESSSEDSGDEVVVDEHSRVQLRQVVATLPENKLREIMFRLIEEVPAVEYAMTREFLTLKRKQEYPELVFCAKCNEQFDLNTEREAEECMVHPGALRADYESFVDWDEEVHGPIDCEETRRQFPENYSWTCCKQDGESHGCVHGLHEPALPSKKQRLMD